MIVLKARYFCKPGKGDEVEKFLKEIKPLVDKHEEGCKVYFANRSNDNTDLFMLYEQYVDEAALESHRETSHYQEIIEGKIVPLLEKRERELFTLAD